MRECELCQSELRIWGSELTSDSRASPNGISSRTCSTSSSAPTRSRRLLYTYREKHSIRQHGYHGSWMHLGILSYNMVAHARSGGP